MKKHFGWVTLLGMSLLGPPLAWGNSFFNRAPQFNLPQVEIAFMGCYWAPLTIKAQGGLFSGSGSPSPGTSTPLYHSGNLSVGVNPAALVDLFSGGDPKPPTDALATALANRAVLEKGNGIGLPLKAVDYSTVYQNALLMHILSPVKWGYNPQLTRYCGMRPYILIGIVDYCGIFEGATKIKEKDNDQPINYWGKRSVLEQDGDVFANKNALHSAALEFFLVSTTDGSTVWQGNVINSTGKGNNYEDLLNGLAEKALKDMARK